MNTEKLSVLLPLRPGPRPATRRHLPHVQLDQWPPSAMVEKLHETSLRLPYVCVKESRMASRETLALTLPDRYALGPISAFIDDHEFCHLHPLPSGSLHLTLPEDVGDCAVETGWAERHPSVQAGIFSATLLMVYAPRDECELEVVLQLVSISHAFASGSLAESHLGKVNHREE